MLQQATENDCIVSVLLVLFVYNMQVYRVSVGFVFYHPVCTDAPNIFLPLPLGRLWEASWSGPDPCRYQQQYSAPGSARGHHGRSGGENHRHTSAAYQWRAGQTGKQLAWLGTHHQSDRWYVPHCQIAAATMNVEGSVVLETIDQDLCRSVRVSALRDHKRQLCADTSPGNACCHTEVWHCRAGEGTSVFVTCL